MITTLDGGLELCVTTKGEVLWLPQGCLGPRASDLWSVVAGEGERSIGVYDGPYQGRRLGYDPDGTRREPSLRPGTGPRWKMVRADGGPVRFTIQAAEGKLTGWYLDVGPAVTVKGEGGKTRTGYRAVLTKKPKEPAAFEIVVIAP
jgi:hypothetical protein